MQIEIDRESSVPLYVQIRNRIREMIFAGSLPDGYRLPPERKLADDLGVNRTTVLAAYRDLKAEGLVDAHVGRGTVVREMDATNIGEIEATNSIHWERFLRDIPDDDSEPALREIREMRNREDAIFFCRGLPARELAPYEQFSAIARELLSGENLPLWELAPEYGLCGLREELARVSRGRDIAASAQDVLVVSGSQQGIDLAARALIEPGDTVVVEELTYRYALYIFRLQGARIVSVPLDDEGMRPDVLEGLLRRFSPKLIFTNPTFHNPTGRVTSPRRRKRIVDIARRYGVPIVEDDTFYDLRYDGEAVPPMKAFGGSDCVIYIGSLSKATAPGLRIGWIVAPRPALKRMTQLKRMTDLANVTLSQTVVLEFLRRGLYPEHLRRIRAIYRKKRDVLLDALKPAGKAGLRWSVPEGGLFVWGRLPEAISPQRFMARVNDRAVCYSPGNLFSAEGRYQDHLRLNFTTLTEEEIVRGMELFVRSLLGCGKDYSCRSCSEQETDAAMPLV